MLVNIFVLCPDWATSTHVARVKIDYVLAKPSHVLCVNMITVFIITQLKAIDVRHVTWKDFILPCDRINPGTSSLEARGGAVG